MSEPTTEELKNVIDSLQKAVQRKSDGWLQTNRELNIEIEAHAKTMRELSMARAKLNALLLELGRPLIEVSDDHL